MTSKKPVLDFRKRKFFRMTRAIFDDVSFELKPVDITVYAVLCMYADNNDMTAYPSVDTLAEKARCSTRTARRSLYTLEEAKYIEIRERRDTRGFQTSNQYVLLDVDK